VNTGPGALYRAFQAAAARHPDRPAFTFTDARLSPTEYTYRRLFDRVAALADGLVRCALPPRSLVGILVPTQEAQVLHYLAALACGLVPAILTPLHRKLNREYHALTTRRVLEYCGFAAVITDSDMVAGATAVLVPFEMRCAAGAAPNAVAEPTEAAFVQFSSGTTGIKRGVPLSDAAVLDQVVTYANTIRLGPADTIVSWLPLYHDMGLMTALNMPLAWGVHTVMIDPLDWIADPSLYLQAVSRFSATLSWHPNFAYAFMASRVVDSTIRGVDLSSLRGLVNCSEPVTHESQQRFAARFRSHRLPEHVFWGCYAMAETGFAITHGASNTAGYLDPFGPVDAEWARVSPQPFVSVGTPLPGVELKAVDGTGQGLPDRRVGELWVRAPFVFDGYFRNPTATAAAFADGWYRTGDLGYRAAGEWFVCGRVKDAIILAGVNLWPSDVEQLTSTVAGVVPGRVAAFAEFDDDLQTERLVVLAETSTDAEAHADLISRIRQVVAGSLGVTAFDVHVVPAGWLIKSSSGKMARTANRKKWQSEIELPPNAPSPAHGPS
jgi:fatty-acyl-CoA synthase